MVLIPDLAAMFATRFKVDGGNLRTRNDVPVEGFRSAMKGSTNMKDKKNTCIPVPDAHDGSVPSEECDIGWGGFNFLEGDIRGNGVVCSMKETCIRKCRVACAIVRDDP